MAFADTVKFTAGSSGTSDFSDGTAVTGFRSLSTGAVTTKTYSYRAFSADLSQWENGSGVYTSGSPGTLARTTIAESSTGSKISFTAAPVVVLTPLKADLDALAPLASPTLTGSPTAPTQTAGDNSTKIATTAYVATAVAGAGGGTWSVIGSGSLSVTTSIAVGGTYKQLRLLFTYAATGSGTKTATLALSGNGGSTYGTANTIISATATYTMGAYVDILGTGVIGNKDIVSLSSGTAAGGVAAAFSESSQTGVTTNLQVVIQAGAGTYVLMGAS